MLKEIVIVFQSWAQAHWLVKQHHSWKWIIFPGIIYTILFITAMIFFWQSANDAVSFLSRQLGIETWLQKARSPFLSFIFLMMGIMLKLTLLQFYFSFFKYLILIAGAPIFAYISARTEMDYKNLPPTEERDSWKNYKSEIPRSITLAIRNCGWQLVYLIGVIFLSLIPVIGWIAPLIALLMECYYFGFSMLDFSLARNGFNRHEAIKLLGSRKGYAIATGFIYYLMHIVLPFAPAYGIITATFTVNKIKH